MCLHKYLFSVCRKTQRHVSGGWCCPFSYSKEGSRQDGTEGNLDVASGVRGKRGNNNAGLDSFPKTAFLPSFLPVLTVGSPGLLCGGAVD